ncbi:MAG: AI-2E family transporter [Betaproteobacteria bacterium]|nr:MAG: AI-2E family transporter [Betaproteobacteria bacterium]
MPAYTTSGPRARRSSLIALVIATAVLYLAADVLIPLAIAILLAFLAAPAVRRLERWKLPRLAATVVVSAVGFGVIFGIGAIAATQAVSLAAKLPEYRHNIATKIHDLRHPDRGTKIGKAAEAIKDIERQAAPERPPLPVKETPGTAFEALAQFAAPVAKPAAMALAVIVFTILMLVNRENMRDRLIGVLGTGRINAMTRAMAEASYRVSRYLATQLVVNAMFGIPFGIALYFIGIPNALLFGLLGMVLRFVPYVGVWVAAAMPAVLAFAISDNWTQVLWTVGVFAALELLLAYVIEPWLYGKSAGLSPVAIIAAVMFWTWLWGPIGLLLATPLTVCVAVIGRHLPELGYLNVLLGVDPVLSPEQRFYQRLLALDHEEAQDMIEQHAAAHGVAATFDEVMVPALTLAKLDRRKGALEPSRERYIYEHVRRIVEELEASPAREAGAPVCVVAAHDEADHIAALMVAKLLPAAQTGVLGAGALASDIAQAAGERRCEVVFISAVPPNAAHYAGYLARRVRRELAGARIAVGVWAGADDVGASRERLLKLGVDDVCLHIAEAPSLVRQLAAAAPAAHKAERPRRSAPR